MKFFSGPLIVPVITWSVPGLSLVRGGGHVVIQLIHITCSWHWFSGHISFTLSGNFYIRMAAVSAQQPGMGNCTDRACNIKDNTNQEDLLIHEFCIRTKMSKLFLLSGQGPSCASIWSYCQTSSKPPLQLCPRRCQLSPKILPSPSCLPGRQVPRPGPSRGQDDGLMVKLGLTFLVLLNFFPFILIQKVNTCW